MEKKIKIMVTVTLLMSFGFFMMFRKELYIPCAILGGVWLFHIIYFILGVKKYTPPTDEKTENTKMVSKITDQTEIK